MKSFMLRFLLPFLLVAGVSILILAGQASPGPGGASWSLGGDLQQGYHRSLASGEKTAHGVITSWQVLFVHDQAVKELFKARLDLDDARIDSMVAGDNRAAAHDLQEAQRHLARAAAGLPVAYQGGIEDLSDRVGELSLELGDPGLSVMGRVRAMDRGLSNLINQM